MSALGFTTMENHIKRKTKGFYNFQLVDHNLKSIDVNQKPFLWMRQFQAATSTCIKGSKKKGALWLTFTVWQWWPDYHVIRDHSISRRRCRKNMICLIGFSVIQMSNITVWKFEKKFRHWRRMKIDSGKLRKWVKIDFTKKVCRNILILQCVEKNFCCCWKLHHFNKILPLGS